MDEYNKQSKNMNNSSSKLNDDEKQYLQPKENGYTGTPLLLIIQIVVCTLIIAGAIAAKTFTPDLFNNFKVWYTEKINDSLIVGDNVDEYIESFQNLISQETKISHNNPSLKSYSKDNNLIYMDCALQLPVESGSLTSNFGARDDGSYHYGIDIGCKENSEIRSVLSGKVEKAEECPSYGKYIIIDHGNNIKSLYAHCNELKVKPADTIKTGQVIALAGSTGDSTGVHLHLEIIISGKNYDPAPLLNRAYELQII